MIKKLKDMILSVLSTKEFYIGFFVAGGFFSHWIFGADNLWEQVTELWIKYVTGINFDITPYENR
jgi:hypothetical protein